MKDLKESIQGLDITEYLSENLVVNEGLKDMLKNLKKKFKEAWQWVTGLVVKLTGSYWCPADDDGNVLNAISPLTAGQAMKDGSIKKDSTFVALGKKAAKIVGFKANKMDATKLYGSGNSISHWQTLIKEAEENDIPINEVKMANEDPQAKYNVVDEDALQDLLKARFKHPKLPRLMIWGAPGIGKTAILMNALKSLPDGDEWNLIVKTLSNETPDNFTLPKYVEINGQEKATDVPKTWLPVYMPTGDSAKDQELDDACGKGLLFIDELSRATPQVLNVILPLVNEGIFNGYKLGSGWVIVVASNRMEDELSGQSEVGNALGNRFAQVYFEPTVKTWKKWAETQNFISPLLISWLSMPENENLSGGKYFYWDYNETGNDVSKIMCSPRSWTNAMRELAVYSHTGNLEGFTIFDIPRSILAMTLNQYVPAEAVDGFLAFLDVISKIGNFDQAVTDIWKNGGKKFKVSEKDLSKIAIPLSQLIVSSHSDKYPSEKEMVNLITWLANMNNDQLASFTLDVCLNVFCGDVMKEKAGTEVSKDTMNIIFKIGYCREENWANTNKEALEIFLKPMLDRWGYTLDTLPNWSPAFDILCDKFADRWEKYEVGDKVGLAYG